MAYSPGIRSNKYAIPGCAVASWMEVLNPH